ncbi:NAD(P)/FAD-dependent oxidoreductase [Pseudomonas sp. gcc21]|uniref:NAD(P)/FAD-dependent oxidoreductase n=1 Tax=Pseudomonas sp. gcc21 TaxID=2726989 RepID=UPI001451CA5A|nr:NAD(P)/FAD-dependent oxidoreductase [Pseudomonas sp. gcc21]QJD59516.1 NAD(P)/FAD-dependent oxidoreductase [Pseudomonas sp. gcc21]
MNDCDVVVAGAGVVGLAIAQHLAAAGRSVMVLEQESWPGQHASSRNSEVIHAGIYYPPGSLKAALCKQGRDLLYDWSERHNVPHRRIGKLLVAVEPGEIAALQALHDNASANGVELQWLNAEQVHELEPDVKAVAGLFSPLTGIIDSHALMQSYEAALQSHGGTLVCNARIEAVEQTPTGLRVSGHSAGESFELSTAWLINAGGLFAQQLAAHVQGFPISAIPPVHYCKGSYFAYSGPSPFRHLVYPMPEANTAGLGVHATLDMGGQLRFGPDVLYQDDLNYQVDPSLAPSFARAIRRYWPQCEPERLVPGYAGIRAKLSGPSEVARDFTVQDARAHGVSGLINLFGIESPGLTSSLAIAEKVAMLMDRL